MFESKELLEPCWRFVTGLGVGMYALTTGVCCFEVLAETRGNRLVMLGKVDPLGLVPAYVG